MWTFSIISRLRLFFLSSMKSVCAQVSHDHCHDVFDVFDFFVEDLIKSKQMMTIFHWNCFCSSSYDLYNVAIQCCALEKKEKRKKEKIRWAGVFEDRCSIRSCIYLWFWFARQKFFCVELMELMDNSNWQNAWRNQFMYVLLNDCFWFVNSNSYQISHSS